MKQWILLLKSIWYWKPNININIKKGIVGTETLTIWKCLTGTEIKFYCSPIFDHNVGSKGTAVLPVFPLRRAEKAPNVKLTTDIVETEAKTHMLILRLTATLLSSSKSVGSARYRQIFFIIHYIHFWFSMPNFVLSALAPYVKWDLIGCPEKEHYLYRRLNVLWK